MPHIIEDFKYGVDNILNTPLVDGWESCGLAFTFLTGFGAEIDLTKTLSKEQRKVLSDFFVLVMYFNHKIFPVNTIFPLTFIVF